MLRVAQMGELNALGPPTQDLIDTVQLKPARLSWVKINIYLS